MEKKFKLKSTDIKSIATGYGGCIATDMITVKGRRVGYMYRDHPCNDQDSGWCFTAGIETQEYMDVSSNHGIYDVNTIANYDPDIVPFLNEPIGSSFERDEDGKCIRSIPPESEP